ncbi:hypothetical protein P3T73_02565 [Kiritimatiellota bacterium B12222]|nr:hypothetical protein P3T73_02565 [Kiritimatiellota bacterium B12222]
MIAIEAFVVLVIIGLIVVVALQYFGQRQDRGEKGDAVKTAEEIKSHQPRH